MIEPCMSCGQDRRSPAPPTCLHTSNHASYDSRPDTLDHIYRVRDLLSQVEDDLGRRALQHDKSKLVDPEKPIFDEFTPKLRESTYGSDEYKGFLAEMGIALDHHYAVNDHHPEHFEYGIQSMNLVQLLEMLADWKAATERHADGDLRRSIHQNAERFGYGADMTGRLLATADYFGWLGAEDSSQEVAMGDDEQGQEQQEQQEQAPQEADGDIVQGDKHVHEAPAEDSGSDE